MANFDVIKELCAQKKISIRKLSRALEIDESSMHLLTRSGRTNTYTLEAIATYLGVSPKAFFKDWQPIDLDAYIAERREAKAKRAAKKGKKSDVIRTENA